MNVVPLKVLNNYIPSRKYTGFTLFVRERYYALPKKTSAYVMLHEIQSGRCSHCFKYMKPTPFQKYTSPNGYTKDHIWPKVNGGKVIVLACYTCNQNKGSRMPSKLDLARASVQWAIFRRAIFQ